MSRSAVRKFEVFCSFEGEERFCDAADSGAVVVNDDQEVVGLLAGQANQPNRPDLKGYGFAAPVNVVTDRLGINILTAVNAGEEQVVDASTGQDSAPRSRVDGVVGELPGAAARFPIDQREVLLGALQVLLETEGGRRYGELVRRHVEEVRTMINTNKRVAVVWRRNDGPLLAQLTVPSDSILTVRFPMRLMEDPSFSASVTFSTYSTSDGSSESRLDIEQLGNSWRRFASMSFNELKFELQNPQNGVFSGLSVDI